MRLIVINAARDPDLERLRRRNPGKVLQRPTIVDAPLAYPSGRRVLPTELLTPEVVDRIEFLASIGNIRVLEMGARERSVDFIDVRRRLGHPARGAAVEDTKQLLDGGPAEIVEMQEAVNPAVPTALPDEPVASTTEVPAVLDLGGTEVPATAIVAGGEVVDVVADDSEAVLAALGGEAGTTGAHDAGAATPETWRVPVDLDELIREARNADLASTLAVFGKSGAGKNKLKLVGEVTTCFAADGDPAVKFKALELLRAARKE